jgi:ABC-2 type transport system ATP-binding protein
VIGMKDGIPALEVASLSRTYGQRKAVDGLSLIVAPGEVVGFLGPNGAGKTTTIRTCLHLIRPTSGSVRVFGRDVWGDGSESLARVGCLIESPAVLPFLSGRDNLDFIRLARGGVERSAVDRTLATVGLSDRSNDHVRTYSLGMKQRLALGLSLLSGPDLLILDEPANGLDPAGIVEMRDLLRRLAGEGKAVLVSSHVLSEVEETCDRVVIINRGKLVREGSVSDLLAGTGQFVAQVADVKGALAALHATSWGANARIRDGRLVTASPTGRGSDLVEFLSQAGHAPETLVEDRRELEDLFLELTHHEAQGQ